MAFDRQADALAHDLAGLVLPSSDAVHGDMGTANILVSGDSIAIVDLGACGPGTRALDYAWLLRQAHHDGAPEEVRTRIRSTGERVAGADVFAVCLLAAVIKMVAFSIRHGHLDAAAEDRRRGRELLNG